MRTRAVRIETLAREIAGAVSDYTSVNSARVIARAQARFAAGYAT